MAGVDQGVLGLQLLAARLRQAGADGLRRELGSQISGAVKPAVAQIHAGMKDYMPNRYAGVLDPDTRITVSQRLGSDTPGVTVAATNRGTKRRKLKRVEAGLLSHPLYGDREHWYTQTPDSSGGMHPGFFTEPLKNAQPQVRAAIIEAMTRVAQQITGGA